MHVLLLQCVGIELDKLNVVSLHKLQKQPSSTPIHLSFPAFYDLFYNYDVYSLPRATIQFSYLFL